MYHSSALSITQVGITVVTVIEGLIRRSRNSFMMIIIIIGFVMQCIKVYATLSQSETTTLNI